MHTRNIVLKLFLKFESQINVSSVFTVMDKYRFYTCFGVKNEVWEIVESLHPLNINIDLFRHSS